MKERFLGISGI